MNAPGTIPTAPSRPVFSGVNTTIFFVIIRTKGAINAKQIKGIAEELEVLELKNQVRTYYYQICTCNTIKSN